MSPDRARNQSSLLWAAACEFRYPQSASEMPWETYQKFAEEYCEWTPGLTAIRHVYGLKSLTPGIVAALPMVAVLRGWARPDHVPPDARLMSASHARSFRPVGE